MGSIIGRQYKKPVTNERKYEVAKLLRNVMKEERSNNYWPPSKPRNLQKFWLYFSSEVNSSAGK